MLEFPSMDTLDIYLIDTPDLRTEDIAGGETRGPCHLRAKILYVSPQKPSYRSGRADVQTLRMLLRDLRQSFQTLHRYFPENVGNKCWSLVTDKDMICNMSRDDVEDIDFTKPIRTSLYSQAAQSTAVPSAWIFPRASPRLFYYRVFDIY